jgi:hypothetical protein
MNRYFQIRRLRGAAFLILVGVLALLNQEHILTWDQSWPFFLILAGILMLLERAAWTADVRDQQSMPNAATPPSTSVGPTIPSPTEDPYREDR